MGEWKEKGVGGELPWEMGGVLELPIKKGLTDDRYRGKWVEYKNYL